MASPSCVCRANLAESPSEVFNVLKGERPECNGCTNKKPIDTMIRQFKARHPRWWVVDGAVMVPIWILERLRHDLSRMS